MNKLNLEFKPEEISTRNAEENKFATDKAQYLPTWLNEIESPIKWLLSLRSDMLIHFKIHKRVRDYAKQDPESYHLRKYCNLLSVIANRQLGFYDCTANDITRDNESDYSESEDESDLFFKEENYNSEKCYLMCKEVIDTMASKEGNVMYQRFGPALEHVLQALRAHMLYLQGKITESQQVSKNIQQLETMSNEDQAGIEGIKGQFLLVNSKDNKATLNTFQKAMQLDPVFPEWIFLTAIVKRHIRKQFREDMTFEEIEYFAKALELEESPKHLLFLAQAYQEMVQFLTSVPKKNRDHRTIKELQIKAVDLFRTSWNLKNDTAAMCRRVGNGLMKIKQDLTDLNLAKTALVKAVGIAPKPTTLHALGRFYYYHEKNDEKACECFEQIKGYLGLTELIRLNLIRDPTFDPGEMLQALGDLAHTQRDEDQIYCDIGFYYLILKRDLEMAVEYFWKVLMVNVNSHIVVKFRSFSLCLPIDYNLNMIEVLFNEIQIFKMNNDCLSQAGIKDVKFLKLFMKTIIENHPQLRDLELDSYLVQKIQQVIEDYKKKLRKRRYGGGQALVHENPHEPSRMFSTKELQNSDENNHSSGIKKELGPCTQRSNNDGHGYVDKRNKFNRQRYDMTVTDWRSENRMRENKN